MEAAESEIESESEKFVTFDDGNEEEFEQESENDIFRFEPETEPVVKENNYYSSAYPPYNLGNDYTQYTVNPYRDPEDDYMTIRNKMFNEELDLGLEEVESESVEPEIDGIERKRRLHSFEPLEQPQNSYSFNRSYNPYCDNHQKSSSSLSSLSTPEPFFGKLSKVKGGRVGLRNLGNTCYLNSTLQCLTAAEELSYHLAEEYEKHSKTDKMFLRAMGRLFHEMWQEEGKSSSIMRSVEPNQFKSVLGHVDSRFSGYRQEDSQEALAIILDKLHEDLKQQQEEEEEEKGDEKDSDIDGWLSYCKKENSIVREIFHGQLKSSLKCSKCSFKSETFDPFCFLNLPIPTNLHSESEKVVPIYDMPNINIVNTRNSLSSNESRSVNSSFNICCYNDRVAFNEDTSYLIVKKTFSSVNEFKSSFRGSGHWIVDFLPSKGVASIKSKLPDRSDLMDSNKIYMAYRAELLYNNYLIMFSDLESNLFGFPVLIKLGLSEELTVELLIENFLKGTIKQILRLRFPSRLESFNELIGEIESDPEEYFRIEQSDISFFSDLKLVHVTILSERIYLLFAKECGGDLNELFEELCKDESEIIEDKEDLEDLEDASRDKYSSYSSYSGYNTPYNTPYNAPSGYSHNQTTVYGYPTVSPPIVIPTLRDCFERLCSVEHLNEWKCEMCQRAVHAEKQLKLWRLPDILICHLKRFSYGSYSGGGAKISTAVDFEMEIDLAELMAEGSPNQSTRYELFAISQHFGSLHYGHYTAVIKHLATDKWFLADDGSITVYEHETNPSWFNTKLKEAAYVLFYRRIK